MDTLAEDLCNWSLKMSFAANFQSGWFVCLRSIQRSTTANTLFIKITRNQDESTPRRNPVCSPTRARATVEHDHEPAKFRGSPRMGSQQKKAFVSFSFSTGVGVPLKNSNFKTHSGYDNCLQGSFKFIFPETRDCPIHFRVFLSTRRVLKNKATFWLHSSVYIQH